MRDINRENDALPFYKQLKEKIMADIETGKLKSGDKLPSERELAEQYHISRMTARHTLSILEREGIVERRVGAGTFIASKIEMDFITFNSFTKNTLAKGMVPSTKQLSLFKDRANLQLANKLKILIDEEVIVLKRLRFVNDIPFRIEESFIPYKFCPGIEEKITDQSSLYQILEEDYGINLIKAKEYMRVTFSDDIESKLLKIQQESPIIRLDTVAFDCNDQEIEFSIALTRSDIVKYYSELTLK